MPDIPITDSIDATINVHLRDDAPLAKSKLSQLKFQTPDLIRNADTPIDQIELKDATFGAKFGLPSMLIANAAKLTVKIAESGEIAVFTSRDKTLFAGDGFAPSIPIGADECWIKFGLNTVLEGKIQTQIDGFGMAIANTAELSFATYTVLKVAAGRFPSLREALETALDNFSIACSASTTRMQPSGTVNVTETSGAVTFSGSYSLPLSVNALAAADLPFNYKIKIAPEAGLQLTGSIKLSGDLITRSHRVSKDELQLGIYKKKGSTFEAAFTAAAGLGADIRKTDLLATVLHAVLPGPKVDASVISQDTAADLNKVLKDSIDRSLSISLNADCSAAFTDEAAVVYSVSLADQDLTQTDAAIALALHGDWTALDSVRTATAQRNVIKNTSETKHKLAINLLGIYNAETVSDFVSSCTILHDYERGRVTITDRSRASRISVSSVVYGADAEKLRSAIAEAFLATVTYTATTSGAAAAKTNPDLRVSQDYFEYQNKMSRQEMLANVLLGVALKLIDPGAWDALLAATPVFLHARVSATAEYDGNSAMRLFFADVNKRVARSRDDLERIGRQMMALLIAPDDDISRARISVLNNDAIWAEMDKNGNPSQFQFIAGLDRLGTNALNDVCADWTDVTWWAKAMTDIPPKLSGVIAAIERSATSDLATDRDFMKARQDLADALKHVTERSHAAFAKGWGLAVMSALSGGGSKLSMDITANGKMQRYFAPGGMGTVGAVASMGNS